ncbi:MAG: chemotaxis protein [bacterium]|nr:chemotaxis protein [bacterium]
MSANSQTLASAKYQKKVGIISKSYKLRKELTEQFAEACEKAGVSQAAQLTKMMQEFIKKQE